MPPSTSQIQRRTQDWSHSVINPNAINHSAADLETLFLAEFGKDYKTRLLGGADEPLYRPASAGSGFHVIDFHVIDFHVIEYTRDYFASALHEIAHWCIAGAARRQQKDYGYWYAPDGRTPAQQQRFEQVEVKPQALEWLFSTAAGFPFRVSADNLEAGTGASDAFRQAIWQQARHYCHSGPPVRAARFIRRLSNFYGVPEPCHPDHYRREQLE